MLQLLNSFLSKAGSIKEQKTEGMAAVVAYLMFASYCLTLVIILCLIGIMPNLSNNLKSGVIKEPITHIIP
ncbi:hypothetical protein [Anabaena sp. UHCC 0399]|uniref:hypothetical protein n=1 Tax=Anabaena sp. UHCC 0399 TaxID=3110238 RepID=UPI002B20BD5A|nr:hypothetical protein [Anabaena sp. UHCC 0399]MEA5567502.1 hypothetical protein [Anabaena sp. UHCC 0399]